jgi:hypothetical protein
MTFALEPACPLFVVVVASTRIPRRNEPGLLGPGQAAPSRGLPFGPPTLRLPWAVTRNRPDAVLPQHIGEVLNDLGRGEGRHHLAH